jgi:UDP-N-acetyl-D-glucosamine dehydrogenase
MKRTVCIQGLGFVGSAMAVACARAGTDRPEGPWFDVIGVDLPNTQGRNRIDAINRGEFPFASTDSSLIAETAAAVSAGNLTATDDTTSMARADIVVVDVPLDIDFETPTPALVLQPFERAIHAIGEHAKPGALIIVETTVPPGTCERIVQPILVEWASKRSCTPFLLAHSYERVMPGEHYLESITSFWRAYSGVDDRSADACGEFLGKVIDTTRFPLKRLSSPTASETAKVLENAYRAANIAFINEWGQFAEKANVDLFEVLDAIRVRPTHNNIRQPGFGVGGYCLTKDPEFAAIAARDLLGIGAQPFPMSELAMRINREMPLHPLALLEERFGTVQSLRIALAGISYRQDVADTRYSPAQTFVEAAEHKGAVVTCFDPLVTHWEELDRLVGFDFDRCPDVDAVVFAVPHREFLGIDPATWLDGRVPVIIDANDSLSTEQRTAFVAAGCDVLAVGRGQIGKRSAT